MRKHRGEESEPAKELEIYAPGDMHQATALVAPGLRISLAGYAAPPLAVALLYFVTAKLGEWLAFPETPVSAFWVANAILLAALAMAPRDRWWTYFLAVLPFHFAAQLSGSPASQAVAQYLLNGLEAALGAWVLQAACSQPRCFDRVRSTLSFIIFGAVAASLIASVLMAVAFAALGLNRDFWLLVATRTITNVFSAVTLVPLIVHSFERVRGEHRMLPVARVAEGGVLAFCLLVIGYLVFVSPQTTPRLGPVLLYAPLPLLIWAAMRFGPTGACSTALLIGGLSTWGVLNGNGPFATHDPVHNALSAVTFQAVTATALLILSSLLEERRLTARSLRASEARINKMERLHIAVLASLHDQIAVLDSSGTVIEINDSWRRFVETCQPPRFDSVLAGENLLDSCATAARCGDPDAAEELDALRAVLEGRVVRRQLDFAETGVAGPRWFDVSIEQLRKQTGGAVISRTDITARKQAESEARNQRQQLMHLGRAAVLGELSGALAHELTQPLTSIMGNAEAGLRLMARNVANDAEMTAILHDIVRDDERASQVIQRLRALLRGGETLRQQVNLNTVIHEVLQLARSELITRNVCVTTNLDRSIPPVIGDRVQMQQVILNLIMNACEAMTSVPPSERKLSLSTLSIPSDEAVEVLVKDTGSGITSGDAERIFQPFVTTKSHGMGLGLAICRSVTQAHRGRLWAENAADGGAIFHLTLPIELGGTLQ